jgi:hypothetical protein
MGFLEDNVKLVLEQTYFPAKNIEVNAKVLALYL